MWLQTPHSNGEAREVKMAQACGACSETTGAREQLSGRVEGLHVTVRTHSEGRMRLEQCKQCKLYHCPFCQPSVYKPKGDYAGVWTHLEIHRLRAVKHGEFNIISCNLNCRGERHFHCPYCAKTISTRRHFEVHLDKCAKSSSTKAKSGRPTTPPDPPVQSATPVGQSAILLLNLTAPFQQIISMGQYPLSTNPPAHSKSIADQHPVAPKAPVTPKSTTDQHPASPDNPVTPKSTTDQHPASPDNPVTPKSTTDQHPASPDNPVTPKSTTDQHPASPDLPVKPKSTTDQHPASPDLPVKPKSTTDQHPASPDLPVKLKSTTDQHPALHDHLVIVTTTSGQPSNPPDQPVTTVAPALTSGQTLRKVRRKIKCPMCNLYLHRKNLRKHKLRKHLISEVDITAKDHLRSQCIDSHNGVYAVAKSYKATAVPVHIIKNRSGSTQTMMCEEDRCKVISDFQRSGSTDNQCPHLRSVDFCSSHASVENLKPDVLEELVTNKLIVKDMKAKCLNLRDQATQNSAPLVTLVDLGGSHCLYLSVFEPKVSQYSKLGRLFVTYNIRGRLWQCDCSPGRLSCLHKCIAKWHLFQTNKELFSRETKEDEAHSIANWLEDSPAETTKETSSRTVFSLGEEGLKQMAKYIYNNKKLPSTFPENLTQFESEMNLSKHLVPAETLCQVCPGQVSLSEPVLITDKARVVTLMGVMEDSSTFFKKCPHCEMVYHYQEWSEGLHNYNNHVILTLQLCMRLQNSIKNDTADGGMEEVLKRIIADESPCGMEVLQAYLHFEALTSHDFRSVVMMDLYQKGIFNMAGIEIHGLSESYSGELNAEEVWDSVCMEIITSSLVARNSAFVATDSSVKEAAVSAVTTSFTLAERKRLNKRRTDECHRALTRYLVKGLHPLSTVESPWFREMTKTLNPKYQLPSRDQLINTLIPSWYSLERKHAIKELLQMSKAAVTCDWWTSFALDHYLTVTLHFVMQGQKKQKVLHTKPVYDAQTDTVVAEQIGSVLHKFGVRDKVVAMTVENAFSMDITIKNMQFRKLRCFTQVLNLAAQKVYTCSSVSRWASKIRAVVVWIKRSSTAQEVLKQKQQLLKLRQHSLELDVRTCWNSLYLMVERFAEQYAAIQATTTDPRIRGSVEKNRLEALTDDDQQKAEEFIGIMKPLYTSSLCVTADKSPTCSQIFPILKKLESHFAAQDDDTLFTTTLKAKVWGALYMCYKDGDTWKFLQESSAMDPRFKNRIESDEIWHRVQNAAVMLTTTTEDGLQLLHEDSDADNDDEYSEECPKRQKLSALEELFEAEDRALKSSAAAEKTSSMPERVQQEIQLYRNLPAVPTSEDALAWWWERRDMLPLLSKLSNSYLCIQAASTPRERAFSSAGDTISHERSHILPDMADMQIFLQRNC